MKIVFFGTGEFGLPSLEAITQSEHQLLCVITSCDKAQGRNLKPGISPVKAWCQQNDIGVLQFENPNSSEAIDKIRQLDADIFVVIAYGYLLSNTLLDCASKMAINVHSSLLPKYRGAAPIHWAMMHGDTETGVSIIQLAARLDSGDILNQISTPILDDDNYPILENRLATLGSKALMQTLMDIQSNKFTLKAQPPKSSFYARKITKEDGKIDWNQNCRHVMLKIRALTLWPGSYFFYNHKRLIVAKARTERGSVHGRVPGTILTASIKNGLHIALADGYLDVQEIQLEGKKRMLVTEFLKGFQISEGITLS